MMAEIPDDVLFIVFSKLPIKSLMRFKCVSRKWKYIIGGNPCFAAMQVNNHNFEDTQALFLLRYIGSSFLEHQTNDGSRVYKVDLNHLTDEFNLNTPSYTLEGSCNGLLLFKNETNRAVLCNPVTQEIAAFRCQASPSAVQKWYAKRDISPAPSSQKNWCARHGFGFDPLSKQYKIVQIVTERRDARDYYYLANTAVKVSNLQGIDLSWRDVKSFPWQYLSPRNVYAGGCLHWTRNMIPRRIVFSFLLDKEEFISTSLPEGSNKTDLVEIRGYLGTFGITSNNKISVWVKKEIRGEWIKEYEIDFTPMDRAYCWKIKVIGTWKNGDLLLLYKHETLFSYNKESNSRTRVEISGMELGMDTIIPLRGSIASISKFIQT